MAKLSAVRKRLNQGLSLLFLLLHISLLFVSFFISEKSLQIDSSQMLCHPGWSHWLGCDALGRDLLARLIMSARLSIGYSFTCSVFSLGLVMIFVWLSLKNRFLKNIIVYLTEITAAFPSILLALMIMALFPGFASARLSMAPLFLILVVGFMLTHWMSTYRILWSKTNSILVEPYYTASVALGASPWYLYRTHIFPVLLHLMILQFLTLFSQALMFEASLGFMGFGFPIELGSWGALLQEGWKQIGQSGWLLWGPSFILLVYLLLFKICLNFVTQRLETRSLGIKI